MWRYGFFRSVPAAQHFSSHFILNKTEVFPLRHRRFEGLGFLFRFELRAVGFGAMSVVAERKASKERHYERRPVLGSPRNNRESVQWKQGSKKLPERRKEESGVVEGFRNNNNGSVGSSCSSDSCSSVASVKTRRSFGLRVKPSGLKSGKVVPDGVEVSSLSSSSPVKLKRCDWITLHSDPIYISFHDEEWGVPVHDDRKLFELLALSVALAELSWPAILNKRDTFRKLFDNFEPAYVAKFTDKKILELKATGNTLVSQPKMRAIVENAKQTLEIQQQFGSFNNYCWSFVNYKPMKNGYRYMRQVPVKTPKAEAMSKDLMQRGFRCVGPTVVYSFMQASGIVNDHLLNCFRHRECDSNMSKVSQSKMTEESDLAKGLENTSLSPD